ncbi:hypothetical protein [Streptacidiphilus sp. P02-A3a]|uniref:hypothetical protein n=1 Tax=Streptacidiphilus sp. P02-A3a TaxID=2704468 RepID=UPI0015FDF573|nr:hypothetical protein [Streptacidiphilus sp. P02-A3a]QMU72942.1 hypothetical protein GXP74_36590 [Streptacidiphilus sp. P02-A3a]
MHTSLGTRTRVAFASAVAVGLALLTAAPASAAGGVPTTPTELFNAYQACSTNSTAPVYVAGLGLVLEGIASDTDSTVATVTEQFQSWPLSDPTQIASNAVDYAAPGNEASVSVADSSLTDGQTYAWQARTVDANGDASAWSAPCYIAIDDTRPAAAPTVTSVNYPTGQADQGGAPIQLTLGANGVSDAGGFGYTWDEDFPVPVASVGAHGIPSFQSPYSDPQYFTRATTLGGSATVSLVPPSDSDNGYMVLDVISLDRAFNESPVATYTIRLTPDAPTITQVTHPSDFGKPTEFKLTPNPQIEAASPVVSYSVTDLSSASQTTTTVKADASGNAELKLALVGIYGDILQVRSTSADGWVSQQSSWNNGNVDTTPTVSSAVYVENGTSGGVGVPGTFTFAPKVTGVASYTYTFSDGTTGTVKAHGASGDAQISWTPTQSGSYQLTVYATTKGNIQLAPYYYSFSVN